MIPITARIETNVAKWMEACGNRLRLNRSNPYVPTFSRTPARSTEPAVGASVCASGSQVCSGKSGTFTANATKNARKSQRAVSTGSAAATCVSWRMANEGGPGCPDREYRNRIPTSRNADPAIVNRKNLIAA